MQLRHDQATNNNSNPTQDPHRSCHCRPSSSISQLLQSVTCYSFASDSRYNHLPVLRSYGIIIGDGLMTSCCSRDSRLLTSNCLHTHTHTYISLIPLPMQTPSSLVQGGKVFWCVGMEGINQCSGSAAATGAKPQHHPTIANTLCLQLQLPSSVGRLKQTNLVPTVATMCSQQSNAKRPNLEFTRYSLARRRPRSSRATASRPCPPAVPPAPCPPRAPPAASSPPCASPAG